jgi:hypothetical protein
MIITAFCQTNAGQANQPGSNSKTVRLVAIPGAQGPNATAFVNGIGNGFVELQNVTAEVSAEFEACQSYRVTIASQSPRPDPGTGGARHRKGSFPALAPTPHGPRRGCSLSNLWRGFSKPMAQYILDTGKMAEETRFQREPKWR